MTMPRAPVSSLSPLETRECRVAFDVMTDGRDAMTASQLRDCLVALGMRVTKSDATAMVYDRDFAGSGTIGFDDFKEIYAAQASDVWQTGSIERERGREGRGGCDCDECCLPSIRRRASEATHSSCEKRRGACCMNNERAREREHEDS
ncbi:hypothetical protein PINS_up006439 [Pythium insidiosum]|nr:hypothetical protein PINS_up006439 [Pythium insidiosum]